MRVDIRRRVALAVVLGPIACSAAPPPIETAAVPAPSPSSQDFSGERAWQHLEALARLGPRVAGSKGAARAREALGDALRALGLEVTEQRAGIEPGSPERAQPTVNLLATIPGASRDLIVLVAPYDSPPGDTGSAATSDASGAALVLELGRALQARGPAYTILLAFVEGDALARGAGADGPPPESVGTGVLVASLAGGGGLERVRLVVGFERVAEPDLRVARDLLSSRALREEFWAAARRLGHTSVFPPVAPFEAVEEGQRAFVSSGMRRTVAIVGSRPGAGGAPADVAARAADGGGNAARASLAAVGAVSLDAIVAISQRLAKIDRFAQSPVSAGPGAKEPPDAGEAGVESRKDAEGGAAR